MTSAWGTPEPAPRRWAAGRWNLELRGDELAGLSYDGTLLTRSIRAVVRDRDWNTVPVEVRSLEVRDQEINVELHFEGFGSEFDGWMFARAEGSTLRVSLDVASGRDFYRNRIGLVILHPPTLAGVELEVTHPSGRADGTSFPIEISPHQPARDIVGLAWTSGGVAARMSFEGDLFEMEDQRNWTDASYKTYSTPLDLRFPVHVLRGDWIRQQIDLTACRVAARPTVPKPDQIVLVPADHRVPRFGLSASTGPDPLPDVAPSADFLLVELEADQANWRMAWSRAVREAAGTPLDVRIVVSERAQVQGVVELIASTANPVIRVGVFSRASHMTEPELWDELNTWCAQFMISPELLGGTRAHFTELNREHTRLPAAIAALTFSSTPQMHVQDQAQLIESIPIQTLTARHAVRIAAGRPVHIGPVSLRPRFNAVATTFPFNERADLDDGYAAQHVPGATDPRQSTRAAAAWLVSSAAAFSIAGVDSVCFFETIGARGVVDSRGRATPSKAAFQELVRLAGCDALRPTGALPDDVHLIAAKTGDTVSALVANLTGRDVSMTVKAFDASSDITIPAYGFVIDEL